MENLPSAQPRTPADLTLLEGGKKRDSREPHWIPSHVPSSFRVRAGCVRGRESSREQRGKTGGGRTAVLRSLATKVCFRNKPASCFKTWARSHGPFSFLKKFKYSQPALPASCAGRANPAFPASVDSAALLCLRFQLQTLWGRRLLCGVWRGEVCVQHWQHHSKAAAAGGAGGERSFVLSLHLIYGSCPICITWGLTWQPLHREPACETESFSIVQRVKQLQRKKYLPSFYCLEYTACSLHLVLKPREIFSRDVFSSAASN